MADVGQSAVPPLNHPATAIYFWYARAVVRMNGCRSLQDASGFVSTFVPTVGQAAAWKAMLTADAKSEIVDTFNAERRSGCFGDPLVTVADVESVFFMQISRLS